MSDTSGWHEPDPARDQPSGQPPMPPPPSQQQGGTKPGVIPLRPLGLGDLLDGAISTMRAYPAVMLGVAAVVAAVTQLMIFPIQWVLDDQLLQIQPDGTVEDPGGFIASLLGVGAITLVIMILARVFLTGFLTAVVGKAVVGRPAPFGEIWAEVRPRLPRLLGLILIYPLVGILLFVPAALGAFIDPTLAILLAVVAVFVAIWLYILFSLATPALVLERTGAFAALGRSRALVKGSWWRVFGITLLAGIIVFVIAGIIAVPFELVGGGANLFSVEATELTTGYLVLSSIGAIIASAITEPFAAGVSALLYTDQRMRREGLDLELQRSAGSDPPRP